MSRFPDPEQTPAGPAYEGRLLDRPDEEVVDQGVAFDLRTLMSRRRLFGLIGLGAGAVVLAACTADGGTPVTTTPAPTTSAPAPSPGPSGSATAGTDLPAGEIPDETAGPYPGDGSNGPNALTQSGIVRSDIRSSIGGGTAAEGVPLTLTLTITDMANGDVPFAGVAVYAWHCDAQGRYSMYSSGVEGETFLRGVQVADRNGQVTFTSIVPGCYAGRWPHIHFEVYPNGESLADSPAAIATSQLAFPESMLTGIYALPAYSGSARNLSQVSLDTDNVFGEDRAALQMATVTGDAASGYTAALLARVDTATAPTGGAAPGAGPGGGGPGGGR